MSSLLPLCIDTRCFRRRFVRVSFERTSCKRIRSSSSRGNNSRRGDPHGTDGVRRKRHNNSLSAESTCRDTTTAIRTIFGRTYPQVLHARVHHTDVYMYILVYTYLYMYIIYINMLMSLMLKYVQNESRLRLILASCNLHIIDLALFFLTFRLAPRGYLLRACMGLAHA